jgi:NEDD8-activating enzyme E1 regulatory subunit
MQSDPFFHLVNALEIYTASPPHTLPLSSTLPDMKSDTAQYIHLQNLYRRQAEVEKAKFVEILRRVGAGFGESADKVTEAAVALSDDFVKNSHALKLLRGKVWGSPVDPATFSQCCRVNFL